MSKQLKPYLPTPSLLKMLAERGMTIEPEFGAQWLNAVGYYRLSGYWYSYRQMDPLGGTKRLDSFQPETMFSDIASLYEFDRKLRSHMLDGLERIEVALRSGLNDEVGALGPMSYKDPTNFRPSFDHSSWLKTANHRVERAGRSSASVQHYAAEYDSEFPIWVLADHLDFADCSRLLQGLPAKSQWSIAQRLGVQIDLSSLSTNQQQKARKNHPLVRWFEQLTILRNTCAHHSRLWNRSFTPASTGGLQTVEALQMLPNSQSERLFGAALLIAHLLTTVSPGSAWASKFRVLLLESLEPIPGRSADEVGCPPGWESSAPFA